MERNSERKRREPVFAYQIERKNVKKRKQMVADQIDALLALAKRVVSAERQPRNIIISPLSIHILMAMCSAGGDGPTRAELLRYFKSEDLEQLNSFFTYIATAVLADGSPFRGPVLSIKNGVWIDQSLNLNPDYRCIVEDDYKAAAEPVDFQNQGEEARKQVNDWAEKETNGLIKVILSRDSISNLTRLILTNVVYFKGAWVNQFNASFTEDRDFYLLNGSSIRVPFMTGWLRQEVGVFDGFKVLRLPYKRGADWRSFSMYIYLPDTRDALPALWENICSEPDFINSHLPCKLECLTAFYIPRFKIDFEFEATRVLKGLGLVNFFKRGSVAGMAESSHSDDAKYLYPEGIVQKAGVEVNEHGTEAAAFTYRMTGGGPPPPPLEFVADHPFAFLIREDTTGLLLFVGILHNPLANAS